MEGVAGVVGERKKGGYVTYDEKGSGGLRLREEKLEINSTLPANTERTRKKRGGGRGGGADKERDRQHGHRTEPPSG